MKKLSQQLIDEINELKNANEGHEMEITIENQKGEVIRKDKAILISKEKYKNKDVFILLNQDSRLVITYSHEGEFDENLNEEMYLHFIGEELENVSDELLSKAYKYIDFLVRPINTLID